MQRTGYGDQKGLILVMNNSEEGWKGKWVKTKWWNTKMVPAAWRGKNDQNYPMTKFTNENGESDFWAPPRGYVVYTPEFF